MKHLDKFPTNYGFLGEEQGEQIHKQIKLFSKRYSDIRTMLRDYCFVKISDKESCKHLKKNYLN